MLVINRTGAALLVAMGALSCLPVAKADVWVFEPSISLDQRFDDNYFLSSVSGGSLSATRFVGDLGLSRESEAYIIKGLARVDALLTSDTDVGDGDLDSNQILILDARRRSARANYGILANYKVDTPSRDIAADLSDPDSLAEDTGLLVSQSLNSNVERQEFSVEPSVEYDITRRLQLNAGVTLTTIDHELPSTQDAIYERYIASITDADGNLTEEPLSYDEVTIDDVGVFTPSGELDDYDEIELEMAFRYKLTPITTLVATGQVSRFSSDVTPASSVPFDFLIADSNESDIRRKPRFESVSTTTQLTIGFERFLTPTLQFKIDGGAYTDTSGFSSFAIPDEFSEELREELTAEDTDSDGFIASTSLIYDAGSTRYTARFAVDVLPSSAGSQVETNELTGQLQHILSPRLNFTLNARAFEPDRLGALVDNDFARRFISFEPRIQWNYSRTWILSAAYRYRRQKARSDPESADSNAVLFSVTYSPPSEIRDRAAASGL